MTDGDSKWAIGKKLGKVQRKKREGLALRRCTIVGRNSNNCR